ncbi:MAG: hypothetical protein V1664_02865 [Candidatus Uhrbacteria bacterium]
MSFTKTIFPLLVVGLLFVGFGCQKNNNQPKVDVPFGWINFESADYGFAVSYPDNFELRSRPLEQQDSSYVGLPGNFFASLRDVKREQNSVTIAAFYAFKDVSVEKFSEALKASDPDNITIKETSDLSQGGLAIKKITSTTAMGTDKIHYVFLSGENLIVISVILDEGPNFEPLLATMRMFSK